MEARFYTLAKEQISNLLGVATRVFLRNTPKTAATQSVFKSRMLFVLALAGIPLWIVGVAISRLGHPEIGVPIRWIAIACMLPSAVGRSSLTLWTFLAMAAGTEFGVDAPHVARQMYFIGELFLRLVRMLVAPLIFASITTGIAAHSHLRSIGRVAVTAPARNSA